MASIPGRPPPPPGLPPPLPEPPRPEPVPVPEPEPVSTPVPAPTPKPVKKESAICHSKFGNKSKGGFTFGNRVVKRVTEAEHTDAFAAQRKIHVPAREDSLPKITPVEDTIPTNEDELEIPDSIKDVLLVIPDELFINVPETTDKPVNEKAVIKSDSQCIDNRWHKANNWYAINDSTSQLRYFKKAYQHKLYKAPIDFCKKWIKYKRSQG